MYVISMNNYDSKHFTLNDQKTSLLARSVTCSSIYNYRKENQIKLVRVIKMVSLKTQ